MSNTGETVTVVYQHLKLQKKIVFAQGQTLTDLRKALELTETDSFFTMDQVGEESMTVDIEVNQEQSFKLESFNGVVHLHDYSNVIPKSAKLGKEDASSQTQNASLGATQNASLGATQNASLGATQNASLGATQNASLGATQNNSLGTPQKVQEPVSQTVEGSRVNDSSSLTKAEEDSIKGAMGEAGGIIGQFLASQATTAAGGVSAQAGQPFVAQNIASKVSGTLFEAGFILESWWKEEITGKKCLKKLGKSFAAQSGVVGASALGATVEGATGALLGSVGAQIGFLVGSVSGGITGRILTSKVLGLLETGHAEQNTKEELLKNARAVLEVSKSSPWPEIVESWRMKAKLYHPDKHINDTKDEVEQCTRRFIDVHQAFSVLRFER